MLEDRSAGWPLPTSRRAAQRQVVTSRHVEDGIVPTDRPVTVRLPQDLVRELMALSIVDGGTLAEQIRSATRQYVDQRKAAPDFQEMVAAAKARQNDTLSALTGR